MPRLLGALALVMCARSASAGAQLIGLVGSSDDARQAVAIGVAGEVYAPDGKGSWVHRLPSTTAEPLVAAGRAGDVVVALGDGVVYRLADNGWSAIRLVQHGKAVLGAGRALAAVGRQVFALDALNRGEPAKLVQAPAPVTAIAAGARAVVVATDAATYRAELAAGKPGKLIALPPGARHARLISDRWAISDRGALELPAVKITRWPAGLAIGAAAAGPDDALVAVGSGRAGLELVTVRAGGLDREPIALGAPLAPAVTAVGVVVDRQGRAVVALSDGRLAVRSKSGWTTTDVRDEPAVDHPGAGPAVTP